MVSNYYSSIDTVDYLNCGDGDSIWTSVNELPLLVGKRAPVGGGVDGMVQFLFFT